MNEHPETEGLPTEEGAPSATEHTDSGVPSGDSAGTSATGDAPAADDGQRSYDAGKIPVDALHRERRMRYEIDNERRRLERELAELRGMVSALVAERKTAAPEPPAEPEEPEPDYDEDPSAWFRWRAAKLEREQAKIAEQAKQISEWRKQQEEAQRLQMQQAQVLEAYRMKAAQFAQQHPDFPSAYNHLVESRVKELMAFGIPQAEAYERMKAEEIQLAALAMSQGIDPAETVYNLARQRGWNGARTTPAGSSQASGAGQPLTSAVGTQAQSSGRVSHPPTNIGRMPGSAGGQKPSLADLAKMSEEEFARTISDSDFRKIMGIE